MLTLSTGGSCGSGEQGLTLMAGASYTLLGRMVGQFVPGPCGDGKDFLFLRFVCILLLLQFFFWCFLLGVPRALLAALVLALQTHFLRPIYGTTAVAVAMNTHTNRLLHTLNSHNWGRRSDPFMLFEGEAVFGKESAGSLLLHGMTVKLLGECGGRGW